MHMTIWIGCASQNETYPFASVRVETLDDVIAAIDGRFTIQFNVFDVVLVQIIGNDI